MSAPEVETQAARVNRSTNKISAENDLCGDFGRGDGMIFASTGKRKVEVFMRGSMASLPQLGLRPRASRLRDASASGHPLLAAGA